MLILLTPRDSFSVPSPLLGDHLLQGDSPNTFSLRDEKDGIDGPLPVPWLMAAFDGTPTQLSKTMAFLFEHLHFCIVAMHDSCAGDKPASDQVI